METGFLNKHDSEYFSTDGFEQSNDFESENSIFNVFPCDYIDRPQENWIIPDEIPTSDQTQKQYKEDYRKTFEDWQQHISSLQSRDEAVKDQLLCSPFSDGLPDIFGAPVSIPIEKIKTEPFFQEEEENLIDIPNSNIKNEQNFEECDKFDIKSLFQTDKTHLSDDPIKLDIFPLKHENIPYIQTSKEVTISQINNKKESLIKEEISYESNSPIQDMPVLSPIGGIEQPKQDSDLIFTMHPPRLEISNNKIRVDREMLTTDLGPDNYDVVEIKVEPEDEETKTVIEAANLDTLLEQFEIMKDDEKIVPKIENGLKVKPSIVKYESPVSSKIIPTQTNKTIKDSLPREVINRIKDSSTRKKGISVVPAARLPAKGFNHMKDPGATKNKFSKMTTAKRGETVKLDHDYCNGIGLNGGEANINMRIAAAGNCTPHSDHSSKKDSGLESGDVSDCSSEPSSTLLAASALSVTVSPPFNQQSLSKSGSPATRISAVHVKPGESLLIKNQIKQEPIINIETNQSAVKIETIEEIPADPNDSIAGTIKEENAEEPKKKKKLNLEEYRSRRKNIKNKPVPTKSFIKAEMNGFRKLPDNAEPAGPNDVAPKLIAESQTQSPEEKKEIIKKRESSKDRRSSRPLQRYRRRSSSSSSSSCGSRSRSRSRWRRERSRRRWYSKGRAQRSRSRSRSSSSTHSLSSSSSLSRSRSRSRSSKYNHYRSRTNYKRNNYNNRHSRYSPERISRRQDEWSPLEKMRQIEERRVIYVGQIEEGTTKSQLRERFETFGPIIDISLHFRERGDNYGFVTFAYKVDAYKAVEHGNDYPNEPQYDICFGGRRVFCKQRYSDLDGVVQGPYHQNHRYHQNPRSNDSFDLLLREAQEKIRKQKHV